MQEFPSGSDYHTDIDKIRVDHHVCSVFLIFLVISRNRIQCKNIYDLSGTVLADNLMLMDGTGICIRIAENELV